MKNKNFSFNEKITIFEDLLIESCKHYLYSEHEDNKNKIANRALFIANEKYNLNGACAEDCKAWIVARDRIL